MTRLNPPMFPLFVCLFFLRKDTTENGLTVHAPLEPRDQSGADQRQRVMEARGRPTDIGGERTPHLRLTDSVPTTNFAIRRIQDLAIGQALCQPYFARNT